MFKKTIIIMAFICIIQIHCLYAKNLGVHGKTYNVAEPDVLAEIRKQVSKVNWEKIIDKKKLLNSAKNYKPVNLKKMKTAKKQRTFAVDMTYTLDFNITDAQGSIIYPAGYRFNPLDYINYTKTLIVINAAMPKQVEWLISSGYAKDINAMVLITDGSYYDISKRLKRPVYFANAELIEKFQVGAVPAVIRQHGNMMHVTEVPPEETRINAKKG